MISWGSTTAQCARAASVGALMSASTPSSTNRSAPPWRQMSPTGARPDNTSLQTAVKVRWLMSHRALSSENETLIELNHSQSLFLSQFWLLDRLLINSFGYTKCGRPPLAAENENPACRHVSRTTEQQKVISYDPVWRCSPGCVHFAAAGNTPMDWASIRRNCDFNGEAKVAIHLLSLSCCLISHPHISSLIELAVRNQVKGKE